jgi:CheY-like chemotaxis protein
MATENQMEPELRVLIVDDDQDDLAMLADAFRSLSAGRWRMHPAAGAAEGLQLIKAEKIQLVIVAVNSPALDVSLLLGSFREEQAQFKTVVMAAEATAEIRAASLAGGADRFFEKPVSPEGLKAVFIGVSELVGWTPPPDSPGDARRVGLVDLIQVECLARNSSVLELFREQSLGRIYVENGQIIHAICGELAGERAFQKLLTLDFGTFELHDFEPPAERTVNRTWEHLLNEAARAQDLLKSAAAAPPVSGLEETIAAAPIGKTMELLVGSAAGEIFYSWQCADPAARVTLLQAMAQRAEQLITRLQLGKLDRLEIELPDGRAILQPRADRLIFVRVTHPEEKNEG